MNYGTVGDTVHMVFVALTICLTSFAMTADPATTLDPLWTTNGFCVVDRRHGSHPHDSSISSSSSSSSRNDQHSTGSLLFIQDTEVICCMLLVASAVASYFLIQHSKYMADEKTNETMLVSSTEKYHRPKMNRLLEMKLESGVMANAAHGLGHLFVYFSPGPPPPVGIDVDDVFWSVANLVMLLGFWVGVIRSTVLSLKLDYKLALSAAVAVLAVQALLQVPPNLSFTYSQSVIFIVSSIDQFIMARRRRRCRDRRKNGHSHPKTITSHDDYDDDHDDDDDDDELWYFIISLSFLPLMMLFPLEAFQCTSTLAAWGGHSVYDAYLSSLPFLLYCYGRTTMVRTTSTTATLGKQKTAQRKKVE